MKIRPATINDREIIWNMLRDYRKASPLQAHDTIDETTAKQTVEVILTQNRGIILLSENNSGITGMLMAVYTFNLWDQQIRYMAELAYWVDPDHRGSTAGYRLLDQYCKVGNLLIEQKEIEYYTISKMVTSPDLKYDRFGFEKLEETWLCQAV
jgi:N-acetylglutamate synthase-like GNAT family acetyltransferase